MEAGDVPDNGASDVPDDGASDELVDDVLEPAGGPQALSVLIGFFGQSDISGHRRLYTHHTFRQWLDIPDADIVHRRRIPAEQDVFGARSVLWVRGGSLMVRGELTTAEVEARFLSGSLSASVRSPLDVERFGIIAPPPDDVEDFAASPAMTPVGRKCCDFTS
jgi:hypothetical protein